MKGPLPENILKRMSPADRQPLGKSGLTQAECYENGAAKMEKDLQRQIGQYLTQRGIPFLCPTYGKKTRVKVGWPDFTLCFEGKFIAFEVKAMKGKLSLDQEKVICDLIYHGARVVVVRELGQVKATLDAIENA